MKSTKASIGRTVPLIDLASEYNSMKEEVDSVLKRVLKSGWFVLGQELANLETEMAAYLDCKYVVCVASGTDALTLSLKALGLEKEDGVVIPANVYPTAFGVALAGVKIQLVDVDPDTLNISLSSLEKVVDRTTKAIVLVHLYGNPVNMSPILNFAKKKKLFIIEDCAQSLGAEYQDRKVGTFGDIGCFSFYPTKTLGAYGDGGAIATNNRKLAEKLKLLRMYGEKSRYRSILIGHNSRLDELQAAILGLKLKKLDKWNIRRREVASIYFKELNNLPIRFIDETPGGKHVYHLLVVWTKQRKLLQEYLAKKGIVTAVHYPVPIHMTASFKMLGFEKRDFPVSEQASKHVLSIPLYAQMKDKDILYVASTIKDFYNRKV